MCAMLRERMCINDEGAHGNFEINWKRKGLIINIFIFKQKAQKNTRGLT